VVNSCVDQNIPGFLAPAAFALKEELQRKLADSRVIRATDCAEGNRGQGGCRIAHIQVVIDVEKLRAELELETFAERKVLEKCHIPIEQCRTADRVPANVAKGPDRRLSE